MHETEKLRREEVNSCQDLQTQTEEDSGKRSRSESQSCARGVRDRMSLGTIIVDARMRARSSLFVTSGVSILEGERCRQSSNPSCARSDKREETDELFVAKGRKNLK